MRLRHRLIAITYGITFLSAYSQALYPTQIISNSGTVVTPPDGDTASTSGANEPAVLAVNTGSSVEGTNLTIETTGNNSAGAQVQLSGYISLDGGSITVSGSNSSGVSATNNGSVDIANAMITVSGTDSSGLFLSSSSINISNSYIEVMNNAAYGIQATALSGTANNTVNLYSTTILSNLDVINADGVPLKVSLSNNSHLSANTGVLLSTSNGAVVDLESNGSEIYGDVIESLSGTATLNLVNDSKWTGSTSGLTSLALNQSAWDLTSSSTVNTLSNAGTISFIFDGNNFKKLVITTAYEGINDATIILNTFLQGDDSSSDTVVINGGSATGKTQLRINNTGGGGSFTGGNGILIVDAIAGGTTTEDAFSLAEPVIAGPFEYSLYRSGINGENVNSWYLRSFCDTEDCNPTDPTNPTNPSGPTVPANAQFRPEVGLYPVLPAMTLLYGQAVLDTLHQRIGQGKWPADAITQNSSSKQMWSRVIGLHGERDRINHQKHFKSAHYDYNFALFQAGGDLIQRETDKGRRDHIGIYGALGGGKGDVKRPNRYLGTNQFSALSTGAYWTVYSPKQAYIDTVLQTTWYYNATSQSVRLNPLNTSGWGFVGSLEGGYPFIIKEQWLVEPQAQALYQTINLQRGADVAAKIHFTDTNSVAGRLGVRLAHKMSVATDKELTTWFRPNFWYQFKGTPKAEFSSIYGYIPFQSQLEGSTVELNLGSTLDMPNNLSLYANGSYGIGLNMHVNSYDGRVGFKVILS